jgi:hypothetical protein
MKSIASTGASANDPLRVGVIVLTVGTALIHLYLGLQGFPLFVLNGLGYLSRQAAGKLVGTRHHAARDRPPALGGEAQPSGGRGVRGPVENSAEGMLVVDESLPGLRLTEPVWLAFEAGRVVSIEGDPGASHLGRAIQAGKSKPNGDT